MDHIEPLAMHLQLVSHIQFANYNRLGYDDQPAGRTVGSMDRP